MGNEKLFTREELRQLLTPTIELLQEALDAKDYSRAGELAQQLNAEAVGLHDAAFLWIASLYTFIGRNYGDEALEMALRESLALVFRDIIPLYQQFEKEGNVRARAELFMRGMRSHFVPMTVEEDDEKITLQMHPCGSGERMIQAGCYEPPINLLKVRKPQPMTFGRADLPAYCAHAAVLAQLSIEATGTPIFCEVPSEELGQKRCNCYFYKDPKDTPGSFYDMVGKKKGQRG